MVRVGVFGLGEAGAELAGGLAGIGAEVAGYDPAPVGDIAGVRRVANPAEAVIDADLVLAVTASADSRRALEQAFDQLPDGAVYADISTSSPAHKRDLATRAGDRVRFVDIALMTDAPGRGLMIPCLASGPGARRYAELLGPAGVPIEVVSLTPGDAATRKLLRSVAIKGLAAVVIESLAAAQAAGFHLETWDNLARQFNDIDASFLERLVEGTPQHAERRFHEMVAAQELLESLGVEPTMTRSTIAHLDGLRGPK